MIDVLCPKQYITTHITANTRILTYIKCTWNAYCKFVIHGQTRFIIILRSSIACELVTNFLLIFFIAYTSLVIRSMTIYTLPYEPRPMRWHILKSLIFTRRFLVSTMRLASKWNKRWRWYKQQYNIEYWILDIGYRIIRYYSNINSIQIHLHLFTKSVNILLWLRFFSLLQCR